MTPFVGTGHLVDVWPLKPVELGKQHMFLPGAIPPRISTFADGGRVQHVLVQEIGAFEVLVGLLLLSVTKLSQG